MKFPLWLILLLFAAWMFWSVRYIYCNFCGCCGNVTAVPAATALPAQTLTGEPLFNHNKMEANTNELFNGWKTKTLAGGGQGDTLVVTGYYHKNEINNTSFADLGLARANAMKALMCPPLPESRIRYASKMIEDDNNTGLHPMTSYSWSKMVLSQESGAIIENGNSTTILFPFRSTAKDRDAKVDAYLSTLCAKHKATNASFSVVGHTDNVGEEEPNRVLGLGRANAISGILRNCGIASNRIKADSKGELEPVADNTSDDGRHLNRRVVITVNQ